MRKLLPPEVATLERYTQQRRQLQRLERMDLAFQASNALIDRIVDDVGAGNDRLMARLLTLKAANYDGRVHRAALLVFVRKLVALSTKRASAIRELDL